MDINKIESISLEEAKTIAEEEILIKEHTCIFVDFGDAFGYSVLVFNNGRHIHYANDYALHHGKLLKEQGKEVLKNFYVKEMNHKLFTEEELLSGAASYDEYLRKEHFLRNYWIMQFDYVSAFGIKGNSYDILAEYTVFDPLSMCYLKDETILNRQRVLYNSLHRSLIYQKNDPKGFREMIRQELANHEACISCSPDEALSALNMDFEILEPWQRHIVKDELNKQIKEYAHGA